MSESAAVIQFQSPPEAVFDPLSTDVYVEIYGLPTFHFFSTL